MTSDEKKSGEENGLLMDDADQVNGLDMDRIPNLEEAQIEAGRPLPKKVELDIDDIFTEEEEEEPEKTPEPEKEAVEVTEAEQPPPKYAFYKVILLSGAGVLFLTGLAVLGLWLVPDIQPPQMRQLLKGPIQMELQPFIINYPGDQGDVIVKLRLNLSFSNSQAHEEFSGRLLTMRDLMFRYMQGQGAIDPNSQKAKDRLREKLIELISGALEKGKIQDLKILEFQLV